MGGEGAGRGAARWNVGDSPPRAPMGFAAPAQDAPLDRGLAPAPAPALAANAALAHSRFVTLDIYILLPQVDSYLLVAT